jgi:excisionase family DNA binding protein
VHSLRFSRMLLLIELIWSKHMQSLADDPIFTQQQIADRWGVSYDTIRRLCAAGELRVIRLSERRLGIRASEEQRYLRERESLTPAA